MVTLDEHCDSGLYTLEYHLVDYMVEDLREFEKLSVLDSSLYECFSVQIKQAYRRTSKMRRSRMIETVNFLQRYYKKGYHYRDEKNGP